MGIVNIFLPLVLFSVFSFTNNARAATNFEIQNKCNYTVWAAARLVIAKGFSSGGQKLDPGQSWSIDVPAGTTSSGTTLSRIWGRTNCNFDSLGRGRCQTGDCNGVLECNSFGDPPNTVAEFALNQFNNLDFFDISLVDGFNIPMEFVGQSAVSLKEKNCIDSCQYDVYADLGLGQLTLIDLSPPSTSGCKGVICSADINRQCPKELRAPGGCNNPCTVFNTTEYCCNSGIGRCGPTNYSRFFKERCPNAYSYPQDDTTSTFTCPSGTNYSVVFCP